MPSSCEIGDFIGHYQPAVVVLTSLSEPIGSFAMNCERIQELYTDLYEGTLPSALKEQSERHIASCTECRSDYARFAEAMGLLNEPLPEVAVPLAFRAEVLAKIATQPKKSQSPFQDWIRSVFGSGDATGFKLAGAALAVAALVVIGYNATLNPSTSEGSSGPNIVAPQPVAKYNGMFTGLSATVNGDKTYHNFTIDLPDSMPQAFVTAYVLQDGRAISDDSALADPASATTVWRENDPLANNVQVNIPVAVVSDMPAGSTLTFLVKATGMTATDPTRTEVAFVPLDANATPLAIPDGTDLYATLKAVAASQNINIVLDNSALPVVKANPYDSTGISGATPLSQVLNQLPSLTAVSTGQNTWAIVAR